jgi:hypothetical protein
MFGALAVVSLLVLFSSKLNLLQIRRFFSFHLDSTCRLFTTMASGFGLINMTKTHLNDLLQTTSGTSLSIRHLPLFYKNTSDS